MGKRCATMPFLRLVGFDREWRGVSPSSAGNGPRCLYLKATTPYVIDPNDRVWASFGTGTHEKLSIYRYTNNVLSEETLSDNEMKGISDVLEEDEWKDNFYILSDYKTWGSYKLAKALGITIKKTDKVILDKDQNSVLLKSGPNKGKPKTVKETTKIVDPSKADIKAEKLQLNRYRIFFEQKGFPISRIQIQAIPRDGNTYIAQSRGIDRSLYIIPIPRLPNEEVLEFYRKLSGEVDEAFKTGYARKCNSWESWDGNKCKKYCEVLNACQKMKGISNG